MFPVTKLLTNFINILDNNKFWQ